MVPQEANQQGRLRSPSDAAGQRTLKPDTRDGENRLVKTETLASAVTAGVPYQRVECVYDSQWRKVRRLRFDQPSSTTPVETTRYLWAGWRCLAEIGATDSISKSLVWGLDQQQILHLGDGNGALLWTNDTTSGETHFCHYDGNGNIVGLSNASWEQTAEYQYSAFGELIGKRGRYADANLYRFSTKPFEEVGNLYYYGYRYLNPLTGGWLSSDPLGEAGGLNQHGFLANSTLSGFDSLGLNPVPGVVGKITTWANDNVGKIMGGLGTALTGAVGSGYSSMGASAAAAVEFGGVSPWLKVPAAGAAAAVAAQAGEDLTANAAAYLRFKKECAEELFDTRWTPADTYVQEALMGAVVGEAGKLLTKVPFRRILKLKDAPKGGVCFPSGTPVLMSNGSSKNIEDVKVGDDVASFDFEKGEVVARKVDFVVKNYTYWWIDLELDDGRNIKATLNHPFWVESLGEWKPAREIDAGMTLRDFSGNTLTVVGRSNITCNLAEATYNFEVSTSHNYFAGDSKVLVHNGVDVETAWFEFQRNYHRIQDGHGFDFEDMRHVPGPDYIPGKTPLPGDASLVFNDAIYHPRSDSYFGRNAGNAIYKFMGNNHGKYHFTQVIEGPRDSKLTKAIYNYFKMLDTGRWPTFKPCY